MKKSIVIVGGHKKAIILAKSILRKGYEVIVINESYEDCLSLYEIPGISVVQGDGTKPYVLDDANILNADIAIALTPNDEDNLMICQLCKTQFSVKKTVAVVSDPKKIDFFYAMGIDRAVCTISTVTSIIEQQAFITDITNIIPIQGGNIQIVEVRIDGYSPAVDKQLWEIDLPSEVIIGCILRGDEALVPRGNSRISKGDTLVLIAGQQQEIPAIKALTGR